jgi:Terpene cyclase DEP1
VRETSPSPLALRCGWPGPSVFAVRSLDRGTSRAGYVDFSSLSVRESDQRIFAMDVLVSAIALISFSQTEGNRLGMRLLWLPMAGVCLVGVSLGLPLFLYFRQLQLDRDELVANTFVAGT